MKKGYKRLLIFQIIVIILFLLNNFVSSILGEYFKALILLILLVSFKFLFGFEKDHHHDSKNICIELLIYLLFYFILYYLLGIVISFAKTVNYLHFNGVVKVIIPTIFTIILKELLRYMMLQKADGSKLLIFTSCLFFVIFDLIKTVSLETFNSSYTIFMYIALTLLPTISKNVFASYVSYKAGYKPVIFYMLVMNLYKFIIPVIPNPNEYIYSVIELIVPMFFLYKVYKYFKKEQDEKIRRDYNKKRVGSLIIPSFLVVFLVYITSGYFYYHAIVVASGSMTPSILKGDVVVIEKVKNKKDIELGTVIAYRYDQRIIVHRLIKKIDAGDNMYYYSKGDANYDMDNYKITEDMIIGVVNLRIPYVGYPTVWLKEL